jgi:hypothetical protein
MLQEIESPSYETRLAILKKKAEGIDINVPISTLEFIADNIKSHVRAMEGALGKVSVFLSSFNGTTLNNEILSHLLKDFIEKEQSLRKLSIEEIQTAVAKKYNVSIAQILSAERTQSIVTPRQLSMYIARKFTTKSLPEIAKLFDKTHATIIHGVRNIEKRLDVESDLKVTLSEILSEFGYKLSDKMRNRLSALGVLMRPEAVAKRGIRAMMRGKRRLTPGLFTRFVVAICAILPARVLDIIIRIKPIRELLERV